MRENLVFLKNIHTFFLKCNYFSNSFATFEQPYVISMEMKKHDVLVTAFNCRAV